MNILLAYRSHPEGARDPFTSLLPAGLLTLNAVLKNEGHRVTLANLSGVPWKNVRKLLKELRPELVGVSQFTHNRVDSVKLAQAAKELDPRCLVVFGGPHATHTAEETLRENRCIDIVIAGEGEESLSELVRVVASGGDLGSVAGVCRREKDQVVVAPSRPPIRDLDRLPMAARYLDDTFNVDPRRQLEFVITSRGCPASCLFCSSPLFWGRELRFRSPAAIVEELRFIRDRYGLIYFSFRDDTFTSNRARVLELCRMIGEERLGIIWNCQSRVNAVDEEMLVAMKRAGCECIQFGVESGSPEMLRALGKKITVEQIERAAAAVRRVGINLSVYLITGIPGENDSHLKESLAVIAKIRAQDGQVSPLVYYPGTRLFSDAVGRAEITGDLFGDGGGEGFPVRRDPFVDASSRALLKGLKNAARKGSFSKEDFERQRALVGYAAVTEMLCAEALEAEGDWEGALGLYRGMIRKEPEHPWGHLLLGGLLARMERIPQAQKAYRELARLVPAHLPAYLALGELALASGDRREARRQFEKARELDPEAVQSSEFRVQG